jgi:MFS superfamily sulfate permease-like transporter
VSSLGRVPDAPGAYSDIGRHPENIPVPGVLIVRVDAQLYYANALTVRERVNEMIAEMPSPPRAVVIDAAAWDEIDLTSTEVIKSMLKELRGNGIDVYFADVHAPVLEFGHQTDLVEAIGEENIYPTVDLAVRSIEAANRAEP